MPSVGAFFQNAFIKPEPQRIPAVVEEAKVTIANWLKLLDDHLKSRKYLLGDEFSAADVMMGYSVNGAKLTGVLDDRFPNVDAYVQRLAERPAFQKASQ
jgi:glutathione S-transferase